MYVYVANDCASQLLSFRVVSDEVS